MKYDFDENIDRRGTNSMKYDSWRSLVLGLANDAPFPYPAEKCIPMWVADMDFATPPEVRDAMKARLDRKILGYTILEDPEYYDSIVQWMKRRHGWKIAPEQIVLSAGVVPALGQLVGLVTKPDEKVLLMAPSYGPFKNACNGAAREVVLSSLINQDGYYTIDFDDFESKAKDPAVTATIFCNPHNPSGRVWTKEELERVGDICTRNGVFIISDEIHCDLIRRDQKHIPLAKLFPNASIATCTAPSKTFNLAGNAFSNIIIQDTEILARWKEQFYNIASPLSIVATQAAYNNCEDWLEQLKRYLDENLQFLKCYLSEHLPQIVFSVPQGTYLCWLNISAFQEEFGEDLVSYIASRSGVILESGAQFVAQGEQFIRLNVACPRSTLEEALNRVTPVLLEKQKQMNRMSN